MATKNDVTGDSLISKASNQKYRDNYDAIFKKKDDIKLNETQTEANSIPQDVSF